MSSVNTIVSLEEEKDLDSASPLVGKTLDKTREEQSKNNRDFELSELRSRIEKLEKTIPFDKENPLSGEFKEENKAVQKLRQDIINQVQMYVVLKTELNLLENQREERPCLGCTLI